MRQFTIMIKPASSLCNLRCGYCFYADVSSRRETAYYGQMSISVARKMIKNIFCDLKPFDRVTFAFQGGEPMLAGLDFFSEFCRMAEAARKNIEISYTIQTNGILMDENWCRFFKEKNFLVGLSLDGPEDFHDQNRIDERGEGTYQKVLHAKEMLEFYQVDYNILTVLTNELAKYPEECWENAQNLKLSYIQYVPCLEDLGSEIAHPYTLTPQRFASFYIRLFELWDRDRRKGKIISVKLFDDILNLLIFHICTACGITGKCSPQLVVESDGSVYPCDFYVLDQHKVGMFTEQTLEELLLSPAMKTFLQMPRETLSLCTQCRYRYLCGGGCKRMQPEVCGTFHDLFCGYKMFLDAVWDKLISITHELH
nr:SPASM domain-containing protein [uncultured Merdimonas sp.]